MVQKDHMGLVTEEPSPQCLFLDNLIRRPLLFFIRMTHKFLTVGAHS